MSKVVKFLVLDKNQQKSATFVVGGVFLKLNFSSCFFALIALKKDFGAPVTKTHHPRRRI